MRNDLRNFNQKFCPKTPANLTPECRKALSDLKMLYEKESIIIRPFDKGVGICLTTSEDYINRTMVHLSDVTNYKVVENPNEFALDIIKKITYWKEDFPQEVSNMNDHIIL